MTAPANRWKLGLFVLGGCGVALSGFTWLGMHELKRAYHTAYAYFDEALTGLEEGSPVRFRGVPIGVVERIRVAPDKKHLEVRASLYDDYLTDIGLDVSRLEGDTPLPENLRAQVVMSWVTSTAFLQVDFFPDPPTGPQQLPFPVGINTLRTVPSTAKGLEDASREVLRELPMMAQAARELIELLRSDLQAARVPELAARLDRVLAHVERELEGLRAKGTVAVATAAMEAFRDTASSLRDEKGPLQRTLVELQAVAGDLRREMMKAELPDTTRALRAAAGDVGGAAGSVEALGEDLRGDLAHLRAALTAVERLADLLERDPGALLRGRGAPARSPIEEKR